MHGGHANEDEPMAEMNLIPLIDVALTLLIILMVTTAFVRQPGVSLKLPETRTREGTPETPKDLTIAIASDGKLYVDARLSTEGEVRSRLVAVAKKDKTSRVLLKGDRDVRYERMMQVMDLVRMAGLTRVVLPTDPKQDVTPAAPATLPPTGTGATHASSPSSPVPVAVSTP